MRCEGTEMVRGGVLCDGKRNALDTARVQSASVFFHPLLPNQLCDEKRATELGAQHIAPGRRRVQSILPAGLIPTTPRVMEDGFLYCNEEL